MIDAGFHRDADVGTGEIDTACRHHRSLCREFGEPLAGQNHDVGGLAAAQPIQKSQRRCIIGVDARAACRLISPGKASHRPFRASDESTRTKFTNNEPSSRPCRRRTRGCF